MSMQRFGDGFVAGRWMATAAALAVLGLSGPAVAQAPPVLFAEGDSLTHGTMDATNNTTNTENAYLQRVADALGQVIDLTFTQPFFTEEGDRAEPFRIPTNLAVDGADIFSAEGLQYYKRAGVDESYVDEAYLCDRLLPRRLDDVTDRVLYPINWLAGMPVAQTDAAEWWLERIAVDPEGAGILILWLGNNDSATAALGSGGLNPSFLPLPFDVVAAELTPALRLVLAVSQAQGVVSFEPYTQANLERNLTDLADFEAQYNRLLDRLEESPGQLSPGIEVFLGTLPYYSSVGYLMDADDLEFYLRKLDPTYSVPNSFQRPQPGLVADAHVNGDRVALLTFGMMYTLLATGHDADAVNAVLESGGVQRDGLVLSESEQETIVARIDAYNAVIAAAAAARGARVHLVDVGALLNDGLAGGVQIGDIFFSRPWGRGNAFSLDGVHPGYTGHGLIAEAMITAINAALGLEAPTPDLEAIAAVDPYVDHDGDGWVPGPESASAGIGELLLLFRDPDDTDAGVQVTLPPDIWEQISAALLRGVLGVDAVRVEARRLGIALPR